MKTDSIMKLALWLCLFLVGAASATERIITEGEQTHLQIIKESFNTGVYCSIKSGVEGDFTLYLLTFHQFSTVELTDRVEEFAAKLSNCRGRYPHECYISVNSMYDLLTEKYYCLIVNNGKTNFITIDQGTLSDYPLMLMMFVCVTMGWILLTEWAFY